MAVEKVFRPWFRLISFCLHWSLALSVAILFVFYSTSLVGVWLYKMLFLKVNINFGPFHVFVKIVQVDFATYHLRNERRTSIHLLFIIFRHMFPFSIIWPCITKMSNQLTVNLSCYTTNLQSISFLSSSQNHCHLPSLQITIFSFFNNKNVKMWCKYSEFTRKFMIFTFWNGCSERYFQNTFQKYFLYYETIILEGIFRSEIHYRLRNAFWNIQNFRNWCSESFLDLKIYLHLFLKVFQDLEIYSKTLVMEYSGNIQCREY